MLQKQETAREEEYVTFPMKNVTFNWCPSVKWSLALLIAPHLAATQAPMNAPLEQLSPAARIPFLTADWKSVAVAIPWIMPWNDTGIAVVRVCVCMCAWIEVIS